MPTVRDFRKRVDLDAGGCFFHLSPNGTQKPHISSSPGKLLLSQLNRAPCSCWQDYRKARGSQKRGDRSADGRDERRIELRIANAETRLVLFTPEGNEHRVGTSFNGSFTCNDVEAMCRQLKQRAVEFLH
jgi:hypothetical protein